MALCNTELNGGGDVHHRGVDINSKPLNPHTPISDMQTLTTQQVHSLNSKHGAGLEEGKGKMYVQSFLINSQQNQAGDPHPFRVDSQLLPKLARTAIGMPWLPYPKSDGNHQRPIGAAAFTADGIKQHQQQFAGGEIVAQYTNEGTGNVNVVIDVFPEYQDAVRSKKIPAFVSPMIFPHDMTPEGLVKEGEILHLQSVHHPGYAPEVAKINSVCEGNGLKQCMTQMKALAASGKLAPFQSKVKNYISKNVSPADKTKMGKVQIGGETNWYDANKNEFQFSPEYKHNFPNPEKLPIVVQHEIGHMHWHHTLTPAQRKAFAKNVPKDLEISPYAIQHKRMLYKAVSNFRKDKSSKNRKAVKRAYGEYIREVFAILHSMRQEPDYVQRLKTDGLKQGMSAYMGALGAAGPLDDAAFNKKVRRVNDSMTKPNRRGHIPNKILKQTDIEDVTRRHASHPKRTPKLNPAKYAPYTPTMKKGDKNWIPAMQMSSTRLSLSQQQLTANKKTFNELIKRNPGLAKTLAAREKVTNSQNRRNQRLFKQAPTLWRGGDEKELEALYRKGHFAGTGGGTGFDFKATSLDKGTAKMFAKGTDPYMMKIDAKPLRDSRLARLVKYSHKPTLEKFGEKYDKPYSDKYLEEKEVRLRPGTPFKFDSGKKLIKQIHFNTSDPKRQKELSAKYGDLAEKITFGDYKALGAKRLGPRHENRKRLKIPGKGLLRRMVKDERSNYGSIIGKDTKRDEPFHGWQTHMRNKIHLATKFYKPDNLRIARIYANDAPRILQASENWKIPKDYPEKELDEIAINHGKLKKGIKNAQAIVDKSKGIKKKPSMTLKATKPPALPNKMGRSDKWDKEERGDMRDGDPDEFDYENYDFKFDPTSKGKRQWHRNPHMKEEYEDQIEDLREDDLLIAEHKKGKFKLPTRLQPALAGDPMRIKKAKRQMQAKRELMRKKLNRKTKVKNRLGEEGQSDRAAERYKAEQSEDKILTKKNTSAKYRRQVKDDRSEYARKNPKYAALRPELRKHLNLKTRRDNKMGKFNVRSNPKNSPDARKERKLNRKSPFEYNKKERKFSASQSGKRRKSMIKNFTPEQKADYFRKLSDIDRTLMMDYSTQINNGTYGNTPENRYQPGMLEQMKRDRLKLHRKTRVANRMGVKPDANMIKTAFSNVLGNQTA